MLRRPPSGAFPATGLPAHEEGLKLGSDPADIFHMSEINPHKGVRAGQWAAVVTAALTIVVLLSIPGQAHAQSDDDLVVTGSGWGHGVGLSQYGAYGMALDGSTYRQILGHYYKGATVKTMGDAGLPTAPTLWVNLEMGRSTLTLRVTNTGSTTGTPVTVTRGAATWTAPVGSSITFGGGTECTMTITRPTGSPTNVGPGSCAFNLSWDGAAANPTTAVAVSGCTQALYTASGVQYVECRYGRGQLHVRPRDAKIDLSASMGMEQYLRGISEMPYSWGNNAMEALKAQAVAARSYARELQIARGNHNPVQNPGNACVAWCHVRDTTFDQRYVGWGQEDTRWDQAVSSTARQVVTHPDAPNGGIVRTYYSSSTGGKTENINEVWGSTPRPFHSMVNDPWSTKPTVNPFASWTVRLRNLTVARLVGLDVINEVRVTSRNSSGSAAGVAFTGTSNGAVTTVTRTSSWMRTTFGLRSIYFSIGVPTGKSATPFTDLAGSVHAAPIMAIAERGITKGCNPPANTHFCPDASVTRGQMAAFLVRALNLPPTDKDFFSDDNGTTFEADINRLAASRVTLGCNPPANNRFCPTDKVSRGQMAAFLDRAFGYTEGGDVDKFTDDNGSPFEANINRIAVAGVTLGCNPPANTSFCPNGNVARGQMASFLDRALTRSGR